MKTKTIFFFFFSLSYSFKIVFFNFQFHFNWFFSRLLNHFYIFKFNWIDLFRFKMIFFLCNVYDFFFLSHHLFHFIWLKPFISILTFSLYNINCFRNVFTVQIDFWNWFFEEFLFGVDFFIIFSLFPFSNTLIWFHNEFYFNNSFSLKI